MSEHILITCPASSIPVKTGFRAAPGSPLEALWQVTLKHCPHCGDEHVWNGKDAYWQESTLQPAPKNGFRQLWRGFLPARAWAGRDARP